MGRIIDETGNRYGRLTVVRRNPENAYHKGANWICRCECGGERVASGIGLRQGLIKSCGCLIRETRVLRCACGYKGHKTPNWTPDWKCYRCSGLSPLQDPPKMTEDEIFEQRVDHWRYYHRSAPTSASNDVMLFLERLEKVTKERDEARDALFRADQDALRVEEERDRLREQLAAKHSDCPDCESYSERAGRFAAQADKLQRERDEARAELAGLPAWQKGCEQALGDLADAEEAIARLYTERDEARALNAEWAQKAATWIASPEAAQRLDGYRDLGQQVAEAQRERDEARAERDNLLDGDGPCHACREYAYRRGAEAMREACARTASVCANHRGEELDAILSALTIPEEP